MYDEMETPDVPDVLPAGWVAVDEFTWEHSSGRVRICYDQEPWESLHPETLRFEPDAWRRVDRFRVCTAPEWFMHETAATFGDACKWGERLSVPFTPRRDVDSTG